MTRARKILAALVAVSALVGVALTAAEAADTLAVT